MSRPASEWAMETVVQDAMRVMRRKSGDLGRLLRGLAILGMAAALDAPAGRMSSSFLATTWALPT